MAGDIDHNEQRVTMSPPVFAPTLCYDCGFVHLEYLSCYSAYKNRYTQSTGLDFWSDRKATEEEIQKFQAHEEATRAK